jgi:hypothetical protein
VVPTLPAPALVRRAALIARSVVFLSSALLPALSLGPLIGWVLGGHPVALRWALVCGGVAVLVVPLAGALALTKVPPGHPWRAWIIATGGLAAPYWWLTRPPAPPDRPARSSTPQALPPLPPVPPLPPAAEWLAPTVLVFRGRRAAPAPPSEAQPARGWSGTSSGRETGSDRSGAAQEPGAPALSREDGRR